MQDITTHIRTHLCEYGTLFALWVLFGIAHSFFASHFMKQIFKQLLPRIFPYNRMIYNFFSAFILGIIVSATYQIPVYSLLEFPVFAQIIFYSIQAAGLLFFLLAAQEYDLTEFFTGEPKSNVLQTGGILNIVRHPFYLATLLIIWFRAITIASVITNLCITIYIFIGIFFEENKLISQFGQAYRDYRMRVPMLFPRKIRKAL